MTGAMKQYWNQRLGRHGLNNAKGILRKQARPVAKP